MKSINLRTALALGAALALGIGVGAAYAGNGDLVIEAYVDDSIVDVLVESVVDPASPQGQAALSIANNIYYLDQNPEQGDINHVLDIPLGYPGDGDTYNPFWVLNTVKINSLPEGWEFPLTNYDEVQYLIDNGYTDTPEFYALVDCPEISVP